MRIGIVGSRRRRDRQTVFDLVGDLPADTVIVSGGARGPDTWAEEAAEWHGLPKPVVHRPDLEGAVSYYEKVDRYYARNRVVAGDIDVLVALVAPDRKGGTENTIKHAKELGKPVIVIPQGGPDVLV